MVATGDANASEANAAEANVAVGWPFRTHAILRVLSAFSVLLIATLPSGARGAEGTFDHTHTAWSELLADYVTWTDNGHSSVVDYGGFKSDQRLTEYLNTLSSATSGEFLGWSQDQQLAFLINTYNAFTVALVSTRYPELASIKDIGGWSSPWSYDFVPLFGRKVSLDYIEHELIRGEGDYSGYDEPRIHFAVNCASIGCPALRPEAYRFDRLNEQLSDAERRFLSDRSRNRFDPATGALTVSPLFDWYGGDFHPNGEALKTYLSSKAHLLTDESASAARIVEKNFSIRFDEYDWKLNDDRR